MNDGRDPSLGRVRPEWVDAYGHMNMAYYLVAFDQATDLFWPRLGLGDEFRAAGLGTFAVETWIDYRRELRGGTPIACDSEVLGFDAKRLLVLHRLRHAAEGWIAAENEVLYLCVDLTTRRVTGWPEGVLAELAGARTQTLPRRLALRRRD